jgi:hypothetical protein
VLAVTPPSLRLAQMVLKIFARGFIMHKHAYLRDPWNWLDFGAHVPCFFLSPQHFPPLFV